MLICRLFPRYVGRDNMKFKRICEKNKDGNNSATQCCGVVHRQMELHLKMQ